MGIQSSTDSHLKMSAKLFILVCVALTCGVQGSPPGCETVYETVYDTIYVEDETRCEINFDVKCETTYETVTAEKCEKYDFKPTTVCTQVPRQVPREKCTPLEKQVCAKKPVKISRKLVREIC